MASITSTGIGSGLDVGNLVSQLVAAEGQPAERRIARGEASAQSRLSAYGKLKSALAEFRDRLESMKDLDGLLARTASSNDEERFTASAGAGAVPASYSVEVVSLAAAERLTSGAFADADTAVGTGSLTLGVGGDTFTVEITEDNASLAGIRDAINEASDNSGVSATIVNADAGSYLILTSELTGAANTLTVTQAGGDGGLSSLEYDPGNGLDALSLTTAAADALVRIDGLEVGSASNSIAGAIDGVTLDLVAAEPGSIATLSVANDTAAARERIDAFVKSYNGLVDTIAELTAFDAETEIAGPLLGDASLRSVRDQLRRELSNGLGDAGAAFGTLGEIGIGIELDGKMKVTDSGLEQAFADDFAAVGRLFAADGTGFAVRLFDRVESFLADDGLISTRTDGLNRTLEGFGEQRERLNERLDALETRLLRQFNALDSLVAQLTSTSNFLSQQLASLPSVGKTSNS